MLGGQGGGGYPGQCPRYPNLDNVQDTLTQTMSELGKFAKQEGGGIPGNVRDTLPRTMSWKNLLCRGGGVSQTMSEIPYPRAESAPQALAYTHTPYHWLLAMAGLYVFPPKTDGCGYMGKPISARLINI